MLADKTILFKKWLPGVNSRTKLKGKGVLTGIYHSLLFFRWHDIANMSHNKSFFALELANKEETIQFQTVSEHKESSWDAFPKS